MCIYVYVCFVRIFVHYTFSRPNENDPNEEIRDAKERRKMAKDRNDTYRIKVDVDDTKAKTN